MKKLISIILCIVFLLSSVSCSKDEYNTKQTEYHEGVEEIEQEILAVYGDYIKFSEPQKDVRFDDVISWDIIFLKSYYYNDRKTAELSPYEIAEAVRGMINEYMSDHLFLDGKKVEIGLCNPARNRYTSEEPVLDSIGFIRNFTVLNDEQYDCLGSVWYEKCDDLVEVIDNKENVYELFIIGSSEEEAARVVGTLPNVQLVQVSVEVIDEDRNARLNELYPQVRFI